MSNQSKGYQFNTLIGAGLIGLGILFLLGEIIDFRLGSYLWPFFVIVPGLVFFYFMVQGGKNAAALAIPGSIITATGLLLFYQNLTNHWESWAYAWALIVPTALGVGFYITGIWGENDAMRQTGQGFIKVGLIMLVLGGMFFEMILNIGGAGPNRVVWPALLIIAGIYMVITELGLLPSSKSPSSSTDIQKEE
jgi:hypothetical protein